MTAPSVDVMQFATKERFLWGYPNFDNVSWISSVTDSQRLDQACFLGVIQFCMPDKGDSVDLGI
ncbi:hypothetical protein [Allocoleopsis franciscana]|uniref:hypothetical protein n=1 Tax=Allocoleopsis franciscana TaxID=2886352 RepID=UPI0012DD1A6E|nr:hypothetical protein [Allocoleopsis franciscana]